MSVFAKIYTNQDCKRCGNPTAVVLISEVLGNRFFKCRFCGTSYANGAPDFVFYAGTVVERTVEFLASVSPLTVEAQNEDERRDSDEAITLLDIRSGDERKPEGN
jgi:ribosomal protein L37AE/L43A